MGKINILDQATINKIAAGEVIERPASVVKELVENAIDAGASSVTIEIKDGGTSLIRVTDNGLGIAEDDIRPAFMPHATSKLKNAEDLEHIASLGFRGEALASIAAVCQVELITKTADSITGFSYVIEGGKEISFDEIGAPDGTTFLVKNIFFNTPARRKFLKTAQTEGIYILEICQHIALSSPQIAFRVILSGQTRLVTNGNGKPKDVIYAIYGKEIAGNLMPVKLKKSALSLTGFIGKPVINRSGRDFENFFVNGRYVKAKLLEKALEDAYKKYLMVHKHPFCVLSLQLPYELLDVNVHPNKMELRFSQEEILYNEICLHLSSVLAGEELIQKTGIGEQYDKDDLKKRFAVYEHIEPFENVRAKENETNKDEEIQKNIEIAEEQKEETKAELKEELKEVPKEDLIEGLKEEPEAEEKAGQKEEPKTEQKEEPRNSFIPIREPVNVEKPSFFDDVFLSKKARVQHKFLGQLFKTYLLVEYDDKLYMIDQHAAHEKVLYEQNIKRLNDKKSGSQLLATPLMLHLSEKQIMALDDSRSVFELLGFDIEEFGANTYCLRAVPDNMFGLDSKEMFYEMLDDMATEYRSKTPDTIMRKIASMSCKAAVKGNMTLTDAEANALIDELLSLENPYFCPHGRPSIISMTKTELEKKFKRIV
ncbi:MAG: DNA mismatch repair endonuclease MutL [Lachnospiraceae bacterium]|nr:DNA mismatch repair endonuclease MutL [Lachnospiraceae bacterium]